MERFLRDLVEIVNAGFLTYILIYTVFLFASVIFGATRIEGRARNDFFNQQDKDQQGKKRQNQPMAGEKDQQAILKDDANYFPISVLVPAFREEETIVDTVKSLRKCDYPQFEIVVIEDGSNDELNEDEEEDRTAELLITTFGLVEIDRPIHRRLPSADKKTVYESVDKGVPITLITKVNGGKADALNMGINASRNPYILSIDADSVVQRDTLRKLIDTFLEDNRVIACGGMIQIANQASIKDGEIIGYTFPKEPLIRLQLLEYYRSFLGSRLFMDIFNGNMIISGACGLFRKDMVIKVGGYDVGVIGEDMELVVKLHSFCRSNQIDYRIMYAPNAVCWTQVPDKLDDLRKQRRRWHTGLVQSLSKHKNVLFNVHYGMMGMVSMIYYLIFEAFAPFIECIGMLFIIFAALLDLLDYPFMIVYFLIFICFSALVTMTSYFSRMYTLAAKIDVKQVLTIVLYSFLECLGFRQIITFFRMTAFWQYNQNKMQWNKFKRRSFNKDEDKEATM